MKIPAVRHPADIPLLGWVGNWGDDRKRFQAVDEYILNEPDLRLRQEADRLASVHGMGADYEIDPNYDPRDHIAKPEAEED